MGPERTHPQPLLGGLHRALLAAGLPLCALLAALAPSWPVPVPLNRPPCGQPQPRPPREASQFPPSHELIRLVGADPAASREPSWADPPAALLDLAADRCRELPG